MLILATWVSLSASLPTYKTGQRIPVEEAACRVLKSQACWVQVLFFLLLAFAPLDTLYHHLFGPQFCHLLNGNHENTYVGVLCLHLYLFRWLVNGSAHKQKAGFLQPIHIQSCSFGPGLTSSSGSASCFEEGFCFLFFRFVCLFF